MRLYHWTCDHGAQGIVRDGGLVQPHPHPWLPEPLAWFTDLESALPSNLGLTSVTLSCDRMAHRFEVVTDGPEPWSAYCRRRGVTRSLRDAFESGDALPAHWWVSTTPVALAAERAA